MKLKSKIIRIIYFSDKEELDKNVLRDVLNKQVSEERFEIDEIISETESLENHNLIYSYDSDGDKIFKLTDEGEDRVEKLLTGSEIESQIKNVARSV